MYQQICKQKNEKMNRAKKACQYLGKPDDAATFFNYSIN